MDDHLVVVATVPTASHSRAAVTAGDLGTDVVPPRGDRLAELGHCPVGYSGHERGIHVPVAAVARFTPALAQTMSSPPSS